MIWIRLLKMRFSIREKIAASAKYSKEIADLESLRIDDRFYCDEPYNACDLDQGFLVIERAKGAETDHDAPIYYVMFMDTDLKNVQSVWSADDGTRCSLTRGADGASFNS
jgi:hypothetical protein